MPKRSITQIMEKRPTPIFGKKLVKSKKYTADIVSPSEEMDEYETSKFTLNVGRNRSVATKKKSKYSKRA
jgi:hypothetical protein